MSRLGTNEKARLVKFEHLIIKVMDNFIGKKDVEENNCLNFIFDFDDLNDYARIVRKHGCFGGCEGRLSNDIWRGRIGKMYLKLADETEYKNIEKKIDNTLIFLEELNKKQLISEKYKFVFLALLVVAVDDTNRDEHISTICDFARMLEISDEEMMDLINVVKYIFQDESYEKPETKVLNYFEYVLKIYD